MFAGKKESARTAPAWASFFSDEQYRSFIAIVENHFRKKRLRYRLGDGVIFLKGSRLGGNHQLGLFNLAQLCARHGQEEWTNIIGDHFQTMEKSQASSRCWKNALPISAGWRSYLRSGFGRKIIWRKSNARN